MVELKIKLEPATIIRQLTQLILSDFIHFRNSSKDFLHKVIPTDVQSISTVGLLLEGRTPEYSNNWYPAASPTPQNIII